MTKSKTLEQYYLDERIAINTANKNVFLGWPFFSSLTLPLLG